MEESEILTAIKVAVEAVADLGGVHRVPLNPPFENEHCTTLLTKEQFSFIKFGLTNNIYYTHHLLCTIIKS